MIIWFAPLPPSPWKISEVMTHGITTRLKYAMGLVIPWVSCLFGLVAFQYKINMHLHLKACKSFYFKHVYCIFLGECLWRELSLYILSYNPSSQSTTFSCHIFTSNSVTWVTNNFYVAQLIEYNLTEKL